MDTRARNFAGWGVGEKGLWDPEHWMLDMGLQGTDAAILATDSMAPACSPETRTLPVCWGLGLGSAQVACVPGTEVWGKAGVSPARLFPPDFFFLPVCLSQLLSFQTHKVGSNQLGGLELDPVIPSSPSLASSSDSLAMLSCPKAGIYLVQHGMKRFWGDLPRPRPGQERDRGSEHRHLQETVLMAHQGCQKICFQMLHLEVPQW